MISRFISKALVRNHKSVLLLGPRQVGKSTLVESLNPQLTINLADEAEYLQFTSHANELRQRVDSTGATSVFIDEVQRIPSLLNTVQALVDKNPKLKFYLTGSSARKLKRGGGNLLPGRVIHFKLGPLISAELDYQANTQKALTHGLLPEMYLTKDKSTVESVLKTYGATYIVEEIKAEALTRNLEAFARFMSVAIQHAGHFLDYSKLAKEAKISRHACARFYEIFEDTLIGHRIWPYAKCAKSADLIKHPKFFVFDNGVYNAIQNNFVASTDRKGVLAEQLIFNQILHSAWARTEDIQISTFRTRGGLEVDLVLEYIGKVIPIKIKFSDNLTSSDVSSLKTFKRYEPKAKPGMVLHLGKASKKIDGLWCHPWQQGLRELGL